MSEKRKHLPRALFYALCEGLKARTDSIQRDRPTKADLARQMSAALGAPVPVSTLDEALAAIGLSWQPPVPTGTAASRPLGTRVAALEQRLHEQAQEQSALRELVEWLYDHFELPYPGAVPLATLAGSPSPEVNDGEAP